jgi:hypothetical protein
MTITVSDILTQTELLSAEEQLELATRLMEQAQQNKDDEVEEGLDVFSLNHVPPKDSYVVMMKFVDAGRGEPTRYDFSEIFGNEEEESAD